MSCGGWQNVLKMAHDISKSNLISGHAKVIVILDGDIAKDVDPYLKEKKIIINIPQNYLPLESFEKYLKYALYDHLDQALFRELNDYIFQRESLDNIVRRYQHDRQNKRNDKDGKEFFSYLDKELREVKRDRREIVDLVVDYILTYDTERVSKIRDFLQKQI